MKRRALTLAFLLAPLALTGCMQSERVSGESRPTSPVAPASQRVVESYLSAARQADGATILALVAAGERKDETAESLRKTAADRYSSGTTWEVLRTEEGETSSKVTVEFKGAEVDPNPTVFALTREGGEWRIVDSPELNEREKNGRLDIKF